MMVSLPMMGTLSSCSSDDSAPALPQPAAKGTFVDARDNAEYEYVQYGNLQWMTSNVKYQTKTNKLYPDFTDKSNAYTHYYVDPANKNYYDQFGGLYTYAAAVEATIEGWRIPTAADWASLEASVGACNVAKAINLSYGGFWNPEERNMKIDDLMYVYGYYWVASEDEKSSEASFIRVFNKGGEPFKSAMSKSYTLNLRLVRDAK